MQNQLSEERLCWNGGVPMGNALYHFIPPDLKVRWEENSKQSAMDIFGRGFRKSKIDGVGAFTEAMELTEPIMHDRSEIGSACRKHLFGGLAQGHLRSFAFEFPRKFTSEPVELAYEHWHGEIKWKINELHCHGLRLIEVRVISTIYAQQLLESRTEKAALPNPPATRGRPSVKHEIEQAFKALHGSGKINVERSAISHFPMIREWIAQNISTLSIDPATINKETIRRITAPMFNSLKSKTNKQ